MTRILHLVAGNHRRGAETFGSEVADPLPIEVAATHRADPRGLARIVTAARWSDVVVSFGSSSLSVGAVAARWARRPFVYRQIGDPSVWGRVRWSDERIGAPARSARRVVALYPGAAYTLIDLYRLDRSTIRIIPRGVPEDRFQPSTVAERSAAQERLGLDPNRSWVAYVGALSEEKDPLLAIDAVAHLGEDVGLVVAGGGPLGSAVTRRATAFGDRVRLLGTVDDVGPVYAASDALVLPSRTEGIPGAAVEAGLCALAVVSFRVGGVPSVVLDGSTGVLVDERRPEALAAGISDAMAHRASYGTAARAHCLEHFSMRSVGRAWEQLIDEVTGSTRRPLR